MRPGGFFLVLVLLAGLTASPALAQRRAPANGVQPLDRILPQIRRSHPGEFYDADGPTPGPGGSEHYHLKWMTPEGRIEWLDTDARTGRVLGASPGRSDPAGAARGPAFAPAPSYPAPQFGGRGAARGGGHLTGRDFGGGGVGGGGGRRRGGR